MFSLCADLSAIGEGEPRLGLPPASFRRRLFPAFDQNRAAPGVFLAKHHKLLDPVRPEMPVAVCRFAPGDQIAAAIEKRDQQRPDDPLCLVDFAVGKRRIAKRTAALTRARLWVGVGPRGRPGTHVQLLL